MQYEMIITIKLTCPLPQMVTIFFFSVRTLKIYSLSKLEVQNTILLTVITMLYIRSSEFTYLILNVCTLYQHLPISYPNPSPGNQPPLYSMVLRLQLYFTYKGGHKVFVCLCLAYLTQHYVPRFICVVANGRIFLFLMAK